MDEAEEAGGSAQALPPPGHPRRLSGDELGAARVRRSRPTSPFVERLVHFWANHFAVSVDKLPVIGLAGLLEFEAIRPHLFGRFSDLLLAVEQHPAMLVYLDQAQSIGPNSQAGRFAAMRGGKQRGLNENLAREIMELHTLGVRTGYSQADVTEFARALTGWTVSGIARGPAARFIGGADDGSFQLRRAASRARRPDDHGQALSRSRARRRRARSCSTSRRARRPRGTSRPSSRAISPATIRRQPMVDRLTEAYLASGGDLRDPLSRADRLARGLGGRSAQIQDAVGMVGLGAARRRVRRELEPDGRRGDAEAARPADLAAGLACRLGRHRGELGRARSADAPRRDRAAPRRRRPARRSTRARLPRRCCPGSLTHSDAHRHRPRRKPAGGPRACCSSAPNS